MAEREVVDKTKVEPLEVFERVKFTGVVFSKQEIVGAKFVDCDFVDCEFVEVEMNDQNLYEDDDDDVKVDLKAEEDAWTSRVRDYDLEYLRDNEWQPGLFVWFLNCRMERCRFDESELTGVFFDGGSIVSTSFEDTSFILVWFRDIELREVTVNYCALANVDFVGGAMDRCRFTDSEWEGGFLKEIDVSDTNFERTSLIKFSLVRTPLTNVIFEDCHTSEFDFDEVEFRESTPLPDFLRGGGGEGERTVSGVALAQGARFESLTIIGADFSFADLRGATFVDCHLENCDFTGADLTPADEDAQDASGRRLSIPGFPRKEVEFSKTSIVDCRFDRANFERARFDEVKISSSSFVNVKVEYAGFRLVEMTEVNFGGAKLRGTGIEDCSLEEVTFARSRGALTGLRKSRFVRCVFEDAILEDSVVTQSTFDECDLKQASKKLAYVDASSRAQMK
jgi:uncharacterized protein YjbI with pentapeptide repeats